MRILSRSSLLLAGLGTVSPAFAQEAREPDPEEDKSPVEVMVITASRTERPAFSTPVATDVITQEEIRIFQPLSFQEIFEQTPGVEVQGGARRIAEEPSIRGFSDTQIILRVDGGRRNFDLGHRGRFFLDPDLVRRIEVARGGASSLFGSGGLGGAIELETLDPRDMLEGETGVGGRVRLGYQSNGDEPLVSGTLFGDAGTVDALASFVWRQTFENFDDGAGQAVIDTQDRLFNGLAKIGVEPADGHRFETIVNVFRSDGESPTAADSVSTPDAVVDRDATVVDVRGIYEFSQPGSDLINGKAVFYYTDYDIFEGRLFDGREDVSTLRTIGGDIRNSFTLLDGDQTQFILTVGFEGFVDTQTGQRNNGPRLSFPDAERRFFAGYAAAELSLFGGQVDILPSVRLDRVQLEADIGDFNQRTETEPSGRIAAGWRPVEPVYLWASWSRAFRSPSLTELFTDGVHFTVPLGPDPMSGIDQIVVNQFVPSPDLASEIARTTEGGVRFQFSGLLGPDEAEINLTGYRSAVDNFVDQTVIFISGPPSFTPPFGPLVFPGQTLNINREATLFGFEGSARYQYGPVRFQLTGHYLGSEVDDSGTGLASIPQNRINALVDVKLPLDLRAGARVTATFDRTNVPEGSITGEGFQTLDLYADWSPRSGPFEGATLRVGVDNVTDATFSIFPSALNQPGRSFRLSAIYRFGG